MDEVLNKLESEGYGCWISSHYYDSIGYADDLKLLSSCIHGMRKITIICEDFVKKCGVQ